MAKIVKKSPAPLYLAAAVWAAWAVLAPLYAWWHFALAAAVSAAAWLGGRKLFPDKVLILPDPEPAPEREPERAAPEDPLAVERARALAELRRLDENIEDAKLSAQAVGKHVHLCPLRRDEAEADGGVAGVDAQDPHGAFPPVYIL